MNTKHSSVVLSIAAMAMLLTIAPGCVTDDSGATFSRDEARSAQSVSLGTVVDVRKGKIEGEGSAVGAIAGGILGAAAGHTIGGGSGKTVATAAGGVGGAALGSAAAKKMTEKMGLQITVKLDNGQTIVVVQDADVMFQPNQRVRVVTTNRGTSRVQPF